jgi:hypothetical protein
MVSQAVERDLQLADPSLQGGSGQIDADEEIGLLCANYSLDSNLRRGASFYSLLPALQVSGSTCRLVDIVIRQLGAI